MRRRILALLLALAALAPAACGPAREIGARPAQRSSATFLDEDEIDRATYQNAFELVQALRSNWLRPRGSDSLTRPTEVLVYRDDVKIGGVDVLRAMPTMEISSIRFIDGITASGRWGLDHGSGVIFVVTR